MDYDVPDSSGTDDDITPSYQDRVPRGVHVVGNGRSAVGSVPFSRMHIDMEAQIHRLEQEAYSAVLRAFKAQADAITWDKETLITELRKELRVSDDEHRELLSKVNADDVIHRIREWREDCMHRPAMCSTSHDLAPSSISASRKKQKTSHSVPSLAYNVPSLALRPPSVAPSMQPSSSGAGLGAGGKKAKPGQLMSGLSTMKSMQYPTTGRSHFSNRGFAGNEAATSDPLIGRKVWTRWPDDNYFYEAVITEYNSVEGRHALVYDINTANETWEWVDLKEISPDDIRWEDDGPVISHPGGHTEQNRGIKKSMTHGGIYPGGGRGRGTTKSQSKKELPVQNGVRKTVSDDIELRNTESLVKEVERVCNTVHPDPLDLQKAKKMLKEHEQALIDAIARLADGSDGGSDEEQEPLSHGGQSIDHD